MKLFSAEHIRSIDNYTIQHEPIASVDLMERAAVALFDQFSEQFCADIPVCIFAGPGNNGGDALALARLLSEKRYEVSVIVFHVGNVSSDCDLNLRRFEAQYPDRISTCSTHFTPPTLMPDTILVDGLFGTGLKRSLQGVFADAVEWMNATGNCVVAIDIPSGLASDLLDIESTSIVKANFTYTLQFPKITFLLPESAGFVGNWTVLDICLSHEAMLNTDSQYHLLDREVVRKLYRPRTKFQHKGNFGHLCVIAGSEKMAGAAVLSARAALRAGAGLVTVQSVDSNRQILQTTVPEAIFSSQNDSTIAYSSISIGPGLGTTDAQVDLLISILKSSPKALVLDADAINILAEHSELLAFLPPQCIFTPHPKEFDRLVGKCNSTTERIQKALAFSANYQAFVVLKGAHTVVVTPSGNLYFNSTGNPGMATAGSGDVLTGVLGALLAQGYSSESAACLGVFLHGLAGDLALHTQSQESLIASDIIENLGAAFTFLNQ